MPFGRPGEPEIAPGEGAPADWPAVERFPVERFRVERTPVARTAATRGPVAGSARAGRPEPATLGDALDVPIERIGRGPKTRAGFVAAAGVAFIAAATLLSAFGYGGQGARATAPAATAATSPLSGGRAAAIAAAPATPFEFYYGNWEAVDWQAITFPDGHSGWGVAAASMPLQLATDPKAPAPVPAIHWAAVASAQARATVVLPPDRRVYAFAITWPKTVEVSGVTVNYIGSQNEVPYVTSGGIAPFAEISPLPATAVIRTPAPPLLFALPTGRPVTSGQFWVPPTQMSPVAGSGSPASAWSTLPWPWPMGDYKVTIATGSGAEVLVLSLQAKS